AMWDDRVSPSASGKSWLVRRVLALHPADAAYELTGSSERLLAYTGEDFRHRIVFVGEAAGLHKDGVGATLMRSIIWDGKIKYATIRITRSGPEAMTVEKEGPVGLITTS